MRRLVAFSQITLDGYFSGIGGNLAWAHKPRQDEEWNSFVESNASGAGVLLFGRVTYRMMASYWPSPQAAKNDPIVAERMNSRPKIVFSKTLTAPLWNNTRLAADCVAEIRKLKDEPGENMAILGSGSIVSRLTQERLIDEYQMVVYPIVLGQGKTPFESVKDPLSLKLTRSRTFANGNVLLCYEPMV